MSTKKKIIVSISALCVALVVALVTVISVFAASSQGTTSQIGVTYKATNVSAKVTGDYMLEGDSTYTSMGAPVEFLPRDVNTTRTMSVNGINLTETKSYVVLRYTFENNSASAKIKISTTVTKNAESFNTRVASAYSTDPITKNYNLISSTDLDDAILNGNDTAYIYVKVDINDVSTSADFEGSIHFDLEYSEETTTTETMGIAKVGDIVERGEYPQTFVGKTLNQTLVNAKASLKETGRTFTTDINKTTTVCKEYLYNNERYVMVENANFYISGTVTFSTGESVGDSGKDFNDNDTVFFKVEPIKFQIMALDEEGGTMTLWSTIELGSTPFEVAYKNQWATSVIRTYLNDTFLKESYLGNSPKEVTIENNVTGEYDVNNGTPTQDKLWLPAITDLQAWYPDEVIEVDNWKNTHEAFKKMTTDFAKATYSIVYDGIGNYLLRSAAIFASSYVFYITNSGSVSSNGSSLALYGFCPAFVTDL